MLEFKLNENNLRKLIVKINTKLDLIASPNIIFDDSYTYGTPKLAQVLQSLKDKYDIILIDTTSDSKYADLLDILTTISDKLICISGGNKLDIKKTRQLLEHIKDKDKLRIIYNKQTRYTIGKSFFRIIFMHNKVIGTIKYNNIFNKIINKGMNELYIDTNTRRNLKKIIKKFN